MDVSLDDLIKQSQASRKAGHVGKGGGRGGGRKHNNNRNQQSGGRVRSKTNRGERLASSSHPYHRSVTHSDAQDEDEDDEEEEEQEHREPAHHGRGMVKPSPQHFVPKHPIPHPQNPSFGAAHRGQAVSIFERIGTAAPSAAPTAAAASGTYVTFSNLNAGITIGDISELCSTIGEVKAVDMDAPSSARSGKKSCKVLFARRSDAVTCITKFNGVTLDGTKMVIQLTGDHGKANPFNPISAAEEAEKEALAKNKRASLFGTALRGDDDDEADDAQADRVAINFGHHGGHRTITKTAGPSRGSGFEHDDRDRVGSGRGAREQHHRGEQQGHSRGGHGTGRGEGRGARDREGGRGQGAGRGQQRREKRESVTVEDLDAAMDNYFQQKTNA